MLDQTKIFDTSWERLGRFLAQRVVVIYLIFFALSSFVFDYHKVGVSSNVKSLNRYRPAKYALLLNLEKGIKKFPKEELEGYQLYYQRVVDLLPHRADAHSMLGFCDYYAGQPKEALVSFERAIALNSHISWFYYNPGVILFKHGSYKEAINFFKAVIETRPINTLHFLTSSVVYLPIISELGATNKIDVVIKKRLKIEYQNSYYLMILGYYHLKDFRQVLNYAHQAVSQNLEKQDFLYYYMGLAAFELQQYKDAARFFSASIEINPNYPDAYYYLGLCMKALGKEGLMPGLMAKASSLHAIFNGPLFDADKVELQMF